MSRKDSDWTRQPESAASLNQPHDGQQRPIQWKYSDLPRRIRSKNSIAVTVLKGHGFIRAVNDPYKVGFNPGGMFF